VSLALALGGLYLARRLGLPVLWIVSLAVLSGAGYVFTHVNYRYAMPGRLLLLMAGAFFIHAVYARARYGVWPTPAPAPAGERPVVSEGSAGPVAVAPR
jgi:hypothetical protein